MLGAIYFILNKNGAVPIDLISKFLWQSCSGCISLVKFKIGLLREVTRILFCERNKKSEKGLIAD